MALTAHTAVYIIIFCLNKTHHLLCLCLALTANPPLTPTVITVPTLLKMALSRSVTVCVCVSETFVCGTEFYSENPTPPGAAQAT